MNASARSIYHYGHPEDEMQIDAMATIVQRLLMV